MSLTNDSFIRTALKEELASVCSSDPNTLILEELGLRHGAARIDIAVINGILSGFEIKSDVDTLERLPCQISIYNSVLDHITIVVGNRHIDEAINLVPNWWGVRLARLDHGDGIHLSDIREPQNNPNSEILAVVKLLWRMEALSLLDEFDAKHGLRYKPRAQIYAQLIEVMPKELLRARVYRQLRVRTNWRSDSQQTSCDD